MITPEPSPTMSQLVLPLGRPPSGWIRERVYRIAALEAERSEVEDELDEIFAGAGDLDWQGYLEAEEARLDDELEHIWDGVAKAEVDVAATRAAVDAVAEARAAVDALEPEQLEALLDLARRRDRATFGDLARALGVSRGDLDTLWIGTRARLGGKAQVRVETSA